MLPTWPACGTLASLWSWPQVLWLLPSSELSGSPSPPPSPSLKRVFSGSCTVSRALHTCGGLGTSTGHANRRPTTTTHKQSQIRSILTGNTLLAIVSCTTPSVADGLLLGLLYAPRVASSGAQGQQVVLRSIPQLGHRISHNIFRLRARDTYNIILCVMAGQSHDIPPQPEYLDHLECQR